MLAPLALTVATTLVSADLDASERAIVAHVATHADEAVALVTETSRINSGTLNPAGVRKVGEVFRKRLAGIGFDTRWITLPKRMKRGGHLFATRRGTRGQRILLIGHLDTVFEPDDPFQRVKRDGKFLVGPGVYDMKGGDVVILAALEALHAAKALDDVTITVALIGDEEKPGKPVERTRRALIDAAKISDVALGFEPGMGEAEVSIARRGSSGWRARITAPGGHSSGIGGAMGYGAIYEAARFLEATRAWFAAHEGLTINPGVVAGGTDAKLNGTNTHGEASGKSNKLGAAVEISGDLRFLSEEQKEEARAAMKKIASAALPKTKVELEFTDGYPAMSPTDANRALFDRLAGVNADLGRGALGLVPPSKRGAADISFVAPIVKASLAGLGPAGSGAHTRKERMDIAHLRVATERAALLIYRLTR